MRFLTACLLRLLLLFLFSTTSVFSQNLARYLSDGDEYLSKGDVYNASLNYAKYLQEDSLNKEALYKYAESLRLLLDYENAKNAYQKLFKKDKGINYLESMFWLAMMQKNLGEYPEAKIMFEKYNKRFKKKGTYLYIKSQLEVEACEWAAKESKNTKKTRIDHLDSLINSPFSEFAAIEIDSSVYFSSSKEKSYSTKKSTPHTEVYRFDLKSKSIQSVDSVFNNASFNNGNCTFSSDGNTCFFTRCKNVSPTETKCAIYKSTKVDGKWMAAKKLNDTINQPEYSSTHPCIAKVDSVGTVLFYSSNRKGGEGKMDLWACKINANGVFGIPYNLGKNVNSMDNEITPFFNDASQTLYFSSDWHKGFGGFDIFKTTRKNRVYDVPENIGYPVNSSYNDLYFTTNASETKAYFSSNREGSYFDKFQNCCNDIYSYSGVKKDSVIKPLPAPILPITKKDTVVKIINELKLLVPLTLYFDNDQPDSKTLNTSTDKTYDQTFTTYQKNIESYKLNYSKGLRGESKIDAENEIIALFGDSIEYGMEQLEKFSKLLARILPEGEQVKITLKGYCSALASSDYNKNLARRRISCLRNYFASYNNGELLPYIITPQNKPNTKGTIEFTEVEIGELNSGGNDDLKNIRLSVYSPQAALERKIQIIALSSK
jgi:Tetratricopeptide repeat